MKAAKLANAIQKVAEMSDRLDVTSKIMSRVGMGFKKGVGKAGKFVIRDAAGGIVGTAFDVVDGVYKNVKKKTSNAYNVFLGTLEAKVQFVGEKTETIRCKIWGKCSAGAGVRIDTTPTPNPLACVGDVALEKIEKVVRNLKPNELKVGTHDVISTIKNGLQSHHIPSYAL